MQRVPLIHSASPQSFTTVPQSIRKLVRKLSLAGKKKHSLAVWSGGMILASVLTSLQLSSCLGRLVSGDCKIEHTRELFEFTRRAVLRTEPGTSHTVNENHTTRPNSQMMISQIALSICATINFLRTQRSLIPIPCRILRGVLLWPIPQRAGDGRLGTCRNRCHLCN